MSLQLVQSIRSKYPATVTQREAWQITNEVAWNLASSGWGLISKSGGTNVDGYSVDAIVNKNTGEFADILGSATGGTRAAATPQWGTRGATESELDHWASPKDPSGQNQPAPIPPTPPRPPRPSPAPPPGPSPPPIGGDGRIIPPQLDGDPGTIQDTVRSEINADGRVSNVIASQAAWLVGRALACAYDVGALYPPVRNPNPPTDPADPGTTRTEYRSGNKKIVVPISEFDA